MSELDLSSNGVCLPASFFSALSKMSKLSELLLQHNSIGDEGLSRLISSLHADAPLERVWLQNNGISLAARDVVMTQLKARSHQCVESVQLIFGAYN